MKIVISASGRKREIEGPYSLCGSVDDLRLLRDELTRALDSNDRAFTYGWVEIIPNRPKIVSTQPEPW